MLTLKNSKIKLGNVMFRNEANSVHVTKKSFSTVPFIHKVVLDFSTIILSPL
jgi:hypothetical protein